MKRMGQQEFYEGGVAQALLIINRVMSIFFALFALSYYSTGTLFPAYVANDLIFLAFAVLLLLTMRKVVHSFGGSRVGIVAAVLGIITGVMGIMFDVFSIIWITVEPFFLITGSAELIMMILVYVFVGLTMLLLGSFLITYRHHVSYSGLWNTTGIIYIVAGALYLSFMLALIGAILMIVAAIMGLVCFFMSQALTKGQ
jgi:hypothetical protein